MKKSRYFSLAVIAMLSALGIVLMLLVRFPIFPSAPFLEYDMGNVPVFAATLLFGASAGIPVLAIIALIQALTVSAASGWVGFLMHFVSTGVFVAVLALLRRKAEKKKAWLVVGFLLGTLAMVLAMIPLNLIFTVHFLGTPLQAVKDMLLPVIIPFNLIKGALSSVVCAFVYFPLKSFIKKQGLN